MISFNWLQKLLKITTQRFLDSKGFFENKISYFVRRMFIINAPMLFTGIWTIIKAWIDEKTKAKIKILGSKYQKELFEVV